MCSCFSHESFCILCGFIFRFSGFHKTFDVILDVFDYNITQSPAREREWILYGKPKVLLLRRILSGRLFYCIVQRVERSIKLPGILPSGLSQIGFTPTRAAQDRRHLLDKGPGMEPGRQVF